MRKAITKIILSLLVTLFALFFSLSYSPSCLSYLLDKAVNGVVFSSTNYSVKWESVCLQWPFGLVFNDLRLQENDTELVGAAEVELNVSSLDLIRNNLALSLLKIKNLNFSYNENAIAKKQTLFCDPTPVSTLLPKWSITIDQLSIEGIKLSDQPLWPSKLPSTENLRLTGRLLFDSELNILYLNSYLSTPLSEKRLRLNCSLAVHCKDEAFLISLQIEERHKAFAFFLPGFEKIGLKKVTASVNLPYNFWHNQGHLPIRGNFAFETANFFSPEQKEALLLFEGNFTTDRQKIELQLNSTIALSDEQQIEGCLNVDLLQAEDYSTKEAQLHASAGPFRLSATIANLSLKPQAKLHLQYDGSSSSIKETSPLFLPPWLPSEIWLETDNQSENEYRVRIYTEEHLPQKGVKGELKLDLHQGYLRFNCDCQTLSTAACQVEKLSNVIELYDLWHHPKLSVNAECDSPTFSDSTPFSLSFKTDLLPYSTNNYQLQLTQDQLITASSFGCWQLFKNQSLALDIQQLSFRSAGLQSTLLQPFSVFLETTDRVKLTPLDLQFNCFRFVAKFEEPLETDQLLKATVFLEHLDQKGLNKEGLDQDSVNQNSLNENSLNQDTLNQYKTNQDAPSQDRSVLRFICSKQKEQIKLEGILESQIKGNPGQRLAKLEAVTSACFASLQTISSDHPYFKAQIHLYPSFASTFSVLPEPLGCFQGDFLINLEGFNEADSFKTRLQVKGGRYELPLCGMLLNQIEMVAYLKGRAFHIEELVAKDSFGGLLNGKGEVNLFAPFHLDLNLQLHELYLIHLQNLKTQVNGKAKVEGGIDKFGITGELALLQASYLVPEQTSDTVQYLEGVTYLNAPENFSPPQLHAPQNKTALPIDLDLALQTAAPLQLYSSNLESFWKGNVKLTHEEGSFKAKGEVKLIQGEYRYGSKSFELKQGQINFAGPIENKISLYIISAIEIGDVTVEAILRGPVKDPALAFRSTPALPQQEILSYLLFGKGLSEITDYQGNQLSRSITSMHSFKNEGEQSFLDKVRSNLPFDSIDINKSPSREGDKVSLQMGKHLSKRLFVSLNKSIGSQANSMAVEAKVVNNIKVRGELNDEAEASVQFKWRKDF